MKAKRKFGVNPFPANILPTKFFVLDSTERY